MGSVEILMSMISAALNDLQLTVGHSVFHNHRAMRMMVLYEIFEMSYNINEALYLPAA